MSAKPPVTSAAQLHPRNRHQGRYDFAALIAASPGLANYVGKNAFGDESVNFANPAAVKALNRALLKLFYNINDWDIPAGYLCPPIPGRADYIHALADLLALGHKTGIPHGAGIRALDVGVGANAVYPLIGHAEYGWDFVGTEVSDEAMQNAQAILAANPDMAAHIELRRQISSKAIFRHVLDADECFDLTLCNPPFHASQAEADAAARRKWQNLGKDSGKRSPKLNFGGQNRELWCAGGEEAFVCQMVEESVALAGRVYWFTSLVSKSASLTAINRALKQASVTYSRTTPMAQGQKQSRLVAWTFMDRQQQNDWRQRRWLPPSVMLAGG
ncbi:23S rRNA (adenine(1618)-N(6))-methyltransferase [Chromobacterium sphagni]|uniref:Ribosomal RNA large subunit methyltransferase F n=1 Tax=Chromobacterium sphagni TaxID=1903179 RepID=A0A1S1WWH2_9NEIS|nr:23S rRNA (adenine(1618)-N(6))-methyltransferase RlmF [Chromobacterium sphagni]OHX11477.1 23S rRNA (adenine(1618)-N(6))-methyltransferase [Chromobacterium sphagni]